MYSRSKCLAIPFGILELKIPLKNNLLSDKPESFCGYYQKPGTTRSWCVNTCRVWPCGTTMNRDGEHNTEKQFESIITAAIRPEFPIAEAPTLCRLKGEGDPAPCVCVSGPWQERSRFVSE